MEIVPSGNQSEFHNIILLHTLRQTIHYHSQQYFPQHNYVHSWHSMSSHPLSSSVQSSVVESSVVVGNVPHSIKVLLCRRLSLSVRVAQSLQSSVEQSVLRSSSRWGSSMSGLSQCQLCQGLFSSQWVKQSVHVWVYQSNSPVQSAVPALYLVVRSYIWLEHIPHAYRELPVKPCRLKVRNEPLDGGVVRHQRLIAEGSEGWSDCHHRQEWQCHHPLDESETMIEIMSVNVQITQRSTTNECQPTNMEN